MTAEPTLLERELARIIAAEGPMPLDRYMSLALGHPQHGYYMGRDPFGRGGDFITAPEISQMFGELIGIWCVAAWQAMGAQERFRLIELGPGRGTLMADLLRAASVMPGFVEAARVELVEMSPALEARQRDTLRQAAAPVTWHRQFADVPAGPSIVVANEFFDALPVAQIARTATGWHERVVGLDGAGRLKLGLARDALPGDAVPAWARDEPEGAIAESGPARADAARLIGERIAMERGAALIVDYGYARSRCGDTLQAVRKHKPVGILTAPGTTDLTAHVDFQALESALAEGGATTWGPLTQGRFLIAMGLREREDAFKRRGDARRRIMIARAATRLAAGNEMGEMFKVIAATHPDLPAPHPFQDAGPQGGPA